MFTVGTTLSFALESDVDEGGSLVMLLNLQGME